MERRTDEVVSEIPLDELVIGNRYTITYIDHMFRRMGGDRIKTFRRTLYQIWEFGRAHPQIFRFVDIRDLSSGGNVVEPLTINEGHIIRVEKYNIAPYGISELSKKINEYIGGRKKRRRKKSTKKKGGRKRGRTRRKKRG